MKPLRGYYVSIKCRKKEREKRNIFKRRTLTGSMPVSLLKDRSSQPSCDGSARKKPRVYWRPTRSVMLLLLRRKERLRYFLFEFVFKGRRPLLGCSESAPEPHKKEKRKKACDEYLRGDFFYFFFWHACC